MTDPMHRLARQLNQIQKAQRDKGSTPQLGNSSIEDGAISDFDVSGLLKQVIGKQYDGTHTVAQFNGLTPPAPSEPTVTPYDNALSIAWDGTWVAGAVTPSDFLRMDVHLMSSIGVDPLVTPSRATISSQGWGEATIPVEPGSYFVALVAWTSSGKFRRSATVGPFAATGTPAPSEDVILVSPDGTSFLLGVADDGTLITTEVV